MPRQIDALIGRSLLDISPIRAIATVVQTGSAGYRKLVTTGGTPSGWVSETAGRPATATPDFAEIAPPTGELYANPAASQAMLDDAAFDVQAWLADEIAREFARAEGAAFVHGSGVNQPRGFLTVTATDEPDDVRAFGEMQYIASGSSGTFGGTNPEDALVDLVHALRPAYRQGAAFVLNSATLARIRKFKTADGAFLWQALARRRTARHAARLSGGGGRGHAGHRRRRTRHRLRQFPRGLSDRRAQRDEHPARSIRPTSRSCISMPPSASAAR